jgi:hypothetical protein
MLFSPHESKCSLSTLSQCIPDQHRFLLEVVVSMWCCVTVCEADTHRGDGSRRVGDRAHLNMCPELDERISDRP